MSQYRLTGKLASRSYELLVGWDTPLSRFFLVIEPELDEPVYSNIYEKDPSSLTLEFFQSVLERYGIENVSGLRLGNEQYCTVALSRLGILQRYTLFGRPLGK